MSTNIKVSKAQMFKINQSGVFLSSSLGNLGKKSLRNIAITLTRDNLPGLVSNLTSNAINKFEWKIRGKGVVGAGKAFNLIIWTEDVNHIMKIIRSFEDSGVLVDGVIATVNREIKEQEDGFIEAFLAPSAASIVQPLICWLVKGRGVRRVGKGYLNKNFYFHSIIYGQKGPPPKNLSHIF